MISIIGIGNGASAVAEKFSKTPQYNVYMLNDKVTRTSKYKFKLKRFEEPEEYEENPPDLTKFFSTVDDHVQVFIVGSSYSSNYSLTVLEQLKGKKIDIFYIKPDITLLTGIPKLMENVAYGVLQEYTRSGVFNSITLLSNMNIEDALGEVPIKSYFDRLNSSIFSTAHYLNYFAHTEPEVGVMARPAEINRIRSVAMLNMKNLEEKWLFDLDTPRDLCYYLCINNERLAKEGTLHKHIVDQLKEKPRNAFRKISYAIYETEHLDFGFCVAHTNVVQENS
jgi:hypothetical protein